MKNSFVAIFIASAVMSAQAGIVPPPPVNNSIKEVVTNFTNEPVSYAATFSSPSSGPAGPEKKSGSIEGDSVKTVDNDYAAITITISQNGNSCVVENEEGGRNKVVRPAATFNCYIKDNKGDSVSIKPIS